MVLLYQREFYANAARAQCQIEVWLKFEPKSYYVAHRTCSMHLGLEGKVSLDYHSLF